jgi:DNA polymerase-3 subunit beta
MKFMIDQATLLKELNLLQGIIERKATLPILSNVLVEALEDGKIKLVATDLEIGFRSFIGASVQEGGTTTVHARRLHDIMRRLPAGNVEFAVEDSALHLRCERIHYRLATQNPGDFPSLKECAGEPMAQIPAEPLADMIRRVLFTIKADDPRYSIGGALWEFSGDTLTLVGTDGHRLSLSRRPADVSTDEPIRLVVPHKAMSELQKLTADHEGDAYLWHVHDSLFVRLGSREVHTSLQEQKFPDYERVIPQGNDKIVRVGAEAIRNAVDRVAVLSAESSRLVKMSLDKDALTVSTSNAQTGEAQEELSVAFEGEPFAIGFNAQYLQDFLGVAGTQEVEMSFGQPMGQGLMRPVREEDDPREDLYIVMPMALS